jgi:hypothetical protein
VDGTDAAGMEDAVPDAAAACSGLTALCVRGCALRDDPCCKTVLSLGALRSLDLSFTRAGDATLSVLALSCGETLTECAFFAPFR